MSIGCAQPLVAVPRGTVRRGARITHVLGRGNDACSRTRSGPDDCRSAGNSRLATPSASAYAEIVRRCSRNRKGGVSIDEIHHRLTPRPGNANPACVAVTQRNEATAMWNLCEAPRSERGFVLMCLESAALGSRHGPGPTGPSAAGADHHVRPRGSSARSRRCDAPHHKVGTQRCVANPSLRTHFFLQYRSVAYRRGLVVAGCHHRGQGGGRT